MNALIKFLNAIWKLLLPEVLLFVRGIVNSLFISLYRNILNFILDNITYSFRCYSLLGELDEAEKKCAFIKNEIESTYLKTCETYNDELSISVPGVACQTENFEFEITELPENQSDLKLKISLTPKRRRGRPAKSQQSIQDVSSKNIEVPSISSLNPCTC